MRIRRYEPRLTMSTTKREKSRLGTTASNQDLGETLDINIRESILKQRIIFDNKGHEGQWKCVITTSRITESTQGKNQQRNITISDSEYPRKVRGEILYTEGYNIKIEKQSLKQEVESSKERIKK